MGGVYVKLLGRAGPVDVLKGVRRIKSIKADLPREYKGIELHAFADWHIGDPLCDMKLIKERIEYVRTTPNAYCVLNGDICNWASKMSVSDVYAEQLTPMQQIEEFVNLIRPIKDKVLAITPGNHEFRSYKTEGIDITEIAARELGLYDKYSKTSALLFIRFGEGNKKESNNSGEYRKLCYTVYLIHGSGGGRKEGAKINKLAELASIVDADIYIHSHTHLGAILKQSFHRVDIQNSNAMIVDKLFVNTAANLNYGGYAEIAEYKPASKANPVIYLSGRKKEFTARL